MGPTTHPAMTGAARDGHLDPSRCGPPAAGAGTLRCQGRGFQTILYRSRSAVPGPWPTLPEVEADPTGGRGRPYPRSGALPDPSGPDGGPTVHAPWGIPYCIQDGMAAERTTPAGSCGDPACPQPIPGLPRRHREPARRAGEAISQTGAATPLHATRRRLPTSLLLSAHLCPLPVTSIRPCAFNRCSSGFLES